VTREEMIENEIQGGGGGTETRSFSTVWKLLKHLQFSLTVSEHDWRALAVKMYDVTLICMFKNYKLSYSLENGL
jgi:hypothetical protein